MATRTLVLLLTALVACGDGGGAPETGVRGVVEAGPQCPVEREDEPCPDQPVAVDIRVIDPATGEVVATATSDEDGRFEVAVPPGTYVLEPVPEGAHRPPIGIPTSVTVREGELAEVTLEVDTGIR